jgi:hypothetical protein
MSKSDTTEPSSLRTSEPSIVTLGRKAAGESVWTTECAIEQTALLSDPASVARQEFHMARGEAPHATPCAKAPLVISRLGICDVQPRIIVQHPEHFSGCIARFGMETGNLPASLAIMLNERKSVGCSRFSNKEPNAEEATCLPSISRFEVPQHGAYVAGISRVCHAETVAP